MKIVSWNVNGLRASLNEGDLSNSLILWRPIIFCIQETKMQQGQVDIGLEGYEEYWNSAVKKGYSGTSCLFPGSKTSELYHLIWARKSTGSSEGRVITLEYRDFYLVNTYDPNAQRGLTRLDYRLM